MAADPFAALNQACLGSFGKAVSYRRGAAEPFSVRGIVMKDSEEEKHAGGLYARLFLDLADLPFQPGHGDVVTIDGVTFTVFQVLIDAMGGVTLSLREAV